MDSSSRTDSQTCSTYISDRTSMSMAAGYPVDASASQTPLTSPTVAHSQAHLNRPVSLGSLLLSRNTSRSGLPHSKGLQSITGLHVPSSDDNVRPVSPSGSVHSVRSASSGTTLNQTASSISSYTHQQATKVILPTNQHGIRTRVNILPGHKAGQHATTKGRPTSSSSNHLLYSPPLPVISPHRHSLDASHLLDQEIQSLSFQIEADNQRIHHGDAPLRSLSEGSSTNALKFTSTAEPPLAGMPGRHADYAFPQRSNTATDMDYLPTVHPDHYATAFQSSSPRTPMLPPFARSDSQNTVYDHQSKPSHSSSLNSNNSGGQNRSLSSLNTSMTTMSSVYETPRGMDAVSNHSSPATSTPIAAQLRGIPMALIPGRGGSTAHSRQPSHQNSARPFLPGSYDFSPSSSLTASNPYDAYNQSPSGISTAGPSRPSISFGDMSNSRNGSPSINTNTPQTFGFGRDRSASVPRTVSSLDDGSDRFPSRDSQDDQSKSSIYADSRRPSGSQLGIASLAPINVKSSYGDPDMPLDERISTDHVHHDSIAEADEHESNDVAAEEDPTITVRPILPTRTLSPISPIAPKLDLDFGNSLSTFAFDFGSFDSLGIGTGNAATAAIPATTANPTHTKTADPISQKPATSTFDFLSQPLAAPPLNFSLDSDAATTHSALRAQLQSQSLGLGLGFPPLSRMTAAALDKPQAATLSESILASNTQVNIPESGISRKRGESEDDKPLASMIASKSPLTELVNGFRDASKPAVTTSLLTEGFLGSSAKPIQSAPRPAETSKPSYSRKDSAVGSHSGRSTSLSRPQSPESRSSSTISRPESSLLGRYRPNDQNRPLIADDHSSDGSRRTTLSSQETFAKLPVRPLVDPASLQRAPSALSMTSVRLSINKSLPPVPSKEDAVDDGHLEGFVSHHSRIPSDRESQRDTAPGPALGLDRNARLQPVDAAQSSSSRTSISQQRGATQPLSIQQRRSRSSTLDRQKELDVMIVAPLRAPHGSADAATNKADLTDFVVHHTRTIKPANKVAADQIAKANAHSKPDPVTDKILAAVVAKLTRWIEHGSKQRDRRGILPSPTQSMPISPRLSTNNIDMDNSKNANGSTARQDAASNKNPHAATKRTVAHADPTHLAGEPPSASKDPNAVDTTKIYKQQNVKVTGRTISDTIPDKAPTTMPEVARQAGLSTSTATLPGVALHLRKTEPLQLTSKQTSNVSSTPALPKAIAGAPLPDSEAWTAITAALKSYIEGVRQGLADRANHIVNTFVPKYKEEEMKGIMTAAVLSHSQRKVLLDWIEAAFDDLQGSPSNRGACLDSIGMVIESFHSLSGHQASHQRFRNILARLLAFAIDKLNGKAIFANTRGFSGKVLAAAYWHLDGVGSKLLRLLPAVKKQHILRIVKESGRDTCPGKFPQHLCGLLFTGDAGKYITLFPSVRTGRDAETYLFSATVPRLSAAHVERGGSADASDIQEIKIEMTGNWLIRWTATDSDLPFAFMRAYHRQLANYLPIYEIGAARLDAKHLISAPGYVYIAATLLEVCDALIHRQLRSVTTMAPPSTGINANESANLQAGQKPKALEVVSKRVVQTIFEVVGGSLQGGAEDASPQAYASASLRHNFGCSVKIWIAAITKRTSMWDTRGIFALLDLIEGLMYNICSPPIEGVAAEEDEIWKPSEIGLALFDTSFILSFIKTILAKADNTTCLLRTISFLYTEFASFTTRPADRESLCDNIILAPEVFDRLFLFYNVGVRGYFLRLLVYRLARLGSDDDSRNVILRDPSIFTTLRLFETRLQNIRERHDELDPLDDYTSDSEDEFRPRHMNRSTICSTWGVRDKPWVMGSPSPRSSLDQVNEDQSAENSQSQLVEAIEERSRDVAATPSATSPLTDPPHGKATKLNAAKKVAGGWWSSLTSKTHRKASPHSGQEILSSQRRLAPITTQSTETASVLPSASDSPLPVTSDVRQEKTVSHAVQAEAQGQSGEGPSRVVGNAAESHRRSSRRSIRKSTSAVTSPHSRRSSTYSFDLSVVTPRSDAFESPLSPTELARLAVPPLGMLSLSPVVFGQFMDTAFNSDTEGALAFSPRQVRPDQRRRKSNSSNRPSRPVSALSDRPGPSPRVSKRFSKRASLLPPPALDLLKESPSEPVPKIPEHFKTPTTGNGSSHLIPPASAAAAVAQTLASTTSEPYDVKSHPYAVRGLREYEDCLDEWELFVVRAQEEEGAEGKELASLIPRLSTAWPSTWED